MEWWVKRRRRGGGEWSGVGGEVLCEVVGRGGQGVACAWRGLLLAACAWRLLGRWLVCDAHLCGLEPQLIE